VNDALIERAQRGDADAMHAVLEEVAPAVHRFGLRMCRSAADADDVLQDTLLSVTTHLADFEGRSSLTSWVFMLARTACARRRRGLKNAPTVSDDAVAERASEHDSPEQQASSRELSVALGSALAALPEEYREVVVLRDVEGLSTLEAAAAVGVSAEAIKSRLHRARSALRDALRPVLEPEAGVPSAQCPAIAEVFSQKLEGELTKDACAVMEQHLATCPACASACDALRTALGACRREASVSVRPAVQARVRAALARFKAHA
jgi:RNA polymerase sigma-70 factor (ECF subfamily)